MSDFTMNGDALSIGKILQAGMEASTHRFESEYRRAIKELQDGLRQEQQNPKIYVQLAKHHMRLLEYNLAIEVLEEGLTRCPPETKLYFEAIDALEEANRTEEARSLASRAAEAIPDDRALFRLKEALLLSLFYDTVEAVAFYHNRFSAGITELLSDLKLDTPGARGQAFKALSYHTNFSLAFQGQNDRDLQQQYGQFVHRIMAANYPDWTRSRAMLPASIEGKIRIGYVSPFLRDHSVAKLFLGWLVEHDRGRFEISAYHLGQGVDAVTENVRRVSDHFRHIPRDLERTCRTILADNLHILVFLDIGMYPLMMQIAALRLAPIQCVTWGHPVTSGSPNVDFFLSSELMEPGNGQDHYSERLIRLPGIGVCYRKPVIPRPLLGKLRSDFGIGENRIAYLCCQNISKYLPQHDDVLVRIAERGRASQFVFLGLNDTLADDLRRRLQVSFKAAGLEASDYCVILPKLCLFDYWNLNLVSDVFLDSLEWSGSISTLEAIACGLPIVTLPGSLMRGRHAYGILTQLGVTNTIARNKEEYVNIAVRLGQDNAWRAQIVERMKANHRLLFGDVRSVRALEEFFRQAVKDARAKQQIDARSPFTSRCE